MRTVVSYYAMLQRMYTVLLWRLDAITGSWRKELQRGRNPTEVLAGQPDDLLHFCNVISKKMENGGSAARMR